MRILAFSDLHLSRARAADLVAASVDADLVLGAGDFCGFREGLAEAMEMLADLAAPLIMVPGNHETAEELRAAARANMRVLHGQGLEEQGLRIFGLGYGIPLSPFGDWSVEMDEDAATLLLDRCTGADLLLTHSPPKGLADRTATGASVGSAAIRAAIERLQPKLALCGHIHESWGQEGRIGGTLVVNLGPTVHWYEVTP
ncbi:metallophosphoesterase family protein [Alterinioella nitratireducens]|uniref:metallophosphoesterase family protein n=1 Tax=Alterinioella nitratireducens TaxID=2735915 RepID=UPI0015581AC6|nr:metallophosphoesterase family protein [Alterinioella nitratireducens]NPD18473.1 serine/threonine protein phosphatase [Alterinioella nitratireducens]